MQWEPLEFHVINAIRPSETIPLVFFLCIITAATTHSKSSSLPMVNVERIDSYELILYNGHESNRCLRQKFLRQKINSSQIKVCRFQWTLTLNDKKNITFQNVSLKGSMRNQNALKLAKKFILLSEINKIFWVGTSRPGSVGWGQTNIF